MLPRYRSTASAARLAKMSNSVRNGNVNSAASRVRTGRTRTVMVTSVSSTIQTFHLRPFSSIVGILAFTK